MHRTILHPALLLSLTACIGTTPATLRWTGTMEPLCMTMHVGPDGKLMPRSDYERCEVMP